MGTSAKKLAAVLCVCAVLLSLCACSQEEEREEPANVRWLRNVSETFGVNSYVIQIMTTETGSPGTVRRWSGTYDGRNAYIKSEDSEGASELCYVRDGEGCKVYIWNAEYEIWLSQDVTADDNMFYAYEVIDRMNKYGSWMDQELIEYDEETQTYHGCDLPGKCVIDGEEHLITDLYIKTDGQYIRSVKERYIIETDDGTAHTRTDELTVSSVGKASITMPEKVWIEQELRDEYGDLFS